MPKKIERLRKSPGYEQTRKIFEEVSQKQAKYFNSWKAKETLGKISKETDTDVYKGDTRTINRVIVLLQEEIDRLENMIDQLSEDSPVGPKFDLEQACFERLLKYVLEEQKKIGEIWGSKM